MDSMSKVTIIVGTKEIEQQIAEYAEIGTDRAPAIVYKKQGVFFKKQYIINLLTDVKEISVLGPEQSRDLAKLENVIKGMNIGGPFKHAFGVVGGLIGASIGKMLPINAYRVTLLCKLHNDDVLAILVDKVLVDTLSKRLELKIPPSTANT